MLKRLFLKEAAFFAKLVRINNMENTVLYASKLLQMKQFFNKGTVHNYDFRLSQLKLLKQLIIDNEAAIYDALYYDLKKSREEVWLTELGFVLEELNYAIRKLKRWMKPEKVRTNLLNFPAQSFIYTEPLGVVCIVAPWNYPFQLLFNPLIGAIAAGNCVVVKPGEQAEKTCELIRHLFQQHFAEEYIWCLTGDGEEVLPPLLDSFRFDHIFFTGSTQVGRKIYEQAATKLTPVTLELGGKSPAVIAEDADIDVAAKRIAFTKFANCGQMCVTTDYVLIHVSQIDVFLKALSFYITKFYGENPAQSEEYGKIINTHHFDRLIGYLKSGQIVYGGTHNRANLYIAPTVLTNIDIEELIMQEEIFGPLLPVIAYSSEAEALHILSRNQNPLAFYIFTKSKARAKCWLSVVPAGGSCINNTVMHLTNLRLPFGGRGASGIGRYHGKFSFTTFSHQRAVLRSVTWPDFAFRYPPFKGKLSFLKKFMGR